MRGRLGAVLAVVLLAGCGGDDEPDKPQRVTVVLEAEGTPTEQELEDAALVVGLRMLGLGARARLAQASGRRITIDLTGDAAARVARDPSVIARARIAFYDWEANVIGPDGRPAPTDQSVTGGMTAGTVSGACSPLADARVRARRSRGDTVLLRAESARGRPDCWFVLRDRPALTGADIQNPDQTVDPQTKEPGVIFDFSARGRRRFSEVTRAIADRGAALGPDQHFAIARDEQILSVPFIDHRENPGGIDGDNGSQISGGFTVASARALAAQLRSGELQLRLRRLSPS